jgi:hypothetical protein
MKGVRGRWEEHWESLLGSAKKVFKIFLHQFEGVRDKKDIENNDGAK